MNKKKLGTVLAAGVLTVGLASSYAYFNAKTTDIKGNNGQTLQALTIQNGKVAVSAKTTSSTGAQYDWSYDVVKYSTDGYKNLEGQNLTDFQNKHRSPDINVTAKTSVNDVERANIGAALPASITNTRPGDAIVLGTKNENGEIGLQVTNDSNLTVKMQLVLKNTNDANSIINQLNRAGWEMYVGDEKVEIAASTTVELGSVIAGGSSFVKEVRFELPLGTGNSYQGKDDGTGKVTGLDLSKLVEIQATQENNDGWNEDPELFIIK